MLRVLWVTLGVAALAAAPPLATPARAQSSAGHGVAAALLADSVRNETCRGGALSASQLVCRGAKYAARVTAIRRFANRLDSLERALVPDTAFVRDTIVMRDTVYLPAPNDSLPPNDSTPARVDVSFGPIVSVSWPGGRVGSLTTAVDAPLCAVVDRGGAFSLGDRSVLATVVSQDSVAFVPNLLPSSAALRAVCAPLFPSLPVATLPLTVVLWDSARVQGAERWVAVPIARIP